METNRVERDPELEWKRKERELFGLEVDVPGGSGDFTMPGSPRFVRKFLLQFGVSTALFAFVWAAFHIPAKEAEPIREAVRQTLSREWDFATVSAWYQEKFGSRPSFLPAFRPKGTREGNTPAAGPEGFVVPVSGSVIEGFSPSHPGIVLRTGADAAVHAVEEGIVLFAGNREDTGYSLVIKHPGGYETTYGFLHPGRISNGDWVKKGQTLGTVAGSADAGENSFYFAVARDSKYVDAAEVIRFD